MLWDHKLTQLGTNYRFEDPQTGVLIGEANGVLKPPLGIQYSVFDANRAPILTIDSERAKLMQYSYLVRDPQGNVLATLKQKSSFKGHKYTIEKDGSEVMLLTTDATERNLKIEDVSNPTHASTLAHFALS
jgi:hypothetical protein